MRQQMNKVVMLLGILGVVASASVCQAAAEKGEVTVDYLKPTAADRDINTVSLHVLEKISQNKQRSVYRGITVTRPYGHSEKDGVVRDSSAVGVGPTYMIRNEFWQAGKWRGAVDMSGSFIIYDKSFPAEGRSFNFMWRIGPQFSYQFNQDTSLNLGYMLMHVSNGCKSQNPSYNARGFSLGLVSHF